MTFKQSQNNEHKMLKNDLKKHRKMISWISAHLVFLGSDFSFFVNHFFFIFIISLSCFIISFSFFEHFSSFSSISSWIFCSAAFSTKKREKCDEHLATSDDNFLFHFRVILR